MDQDLVIAVRRGEVKLAQEGKYHTQDEFDKVSLLFKKGQGITEIALEIQRTELATIQIVEKLDLFERKKKKARTRVLAFFYDFNCSFQTPYCRHIQSSGFIRIGICLRIGKFVAVNACSTLNKRSNV